MESQSPCNGLTWLGPLLFPRSNLWLLSLHSLHSSYTGLPDAVPTCWEYSCSRLLCWLCLLLGPPFPKLSACLPLSYPHVFSQMPFSWWSFPWLYIKYNPLVPTLPILLTLLCFVFSIDFIMSIFSHLNVCSIRAGVFYQFCLLMDPNGLEQSLACSRYPQNICLISKIGKSIWGQILHKGKNWEDLTQSPGMIKPCSKSMLDLFLVLSDFTF